VLPVGCGKRPGETNDGSSRTTAGNLESTTDFQPRALPQREATVNDGWRFSVGFDTASSIVSLVQPSLSLWHGRRSVTYPAGFEQTFTNDPLSRVDSEVYAAVVTVENTRGTGRQLRIPLPEDVVIREEQKRMPACAFLMPRNRWAVEMKGTPEVEFAAHEAAELLYLVPVFGEDAVFEIDGRATLTARPPGLGPGPLNGPRCENCRRVNVLCIQMDLQFHLDQTADPHASLPPDFAALFDPGFGNPAGFFRHFVCPSTDTKPASGVDEFKTGQHCDYRYFGKGLSLDVVRASVKGIIIVSDKPANHPGHFNVLVADAPEIREWSRKGYAGRSLEAIADENDLYLPGYNMPHKDRTKRESKAE